MPIQSFTVSENNKRQRIDRFLSLNMDGMTRSQIKLRTLVIRLNGKPSKLSAECEAGDRIEVELNEPAPSDLSPENIEIPVLFEDKNVIVVNKPSGMVVHPAAGNRSGTLVHGLLYRFEELRDQEFEDESRPGIVHRLDKDTSGVMIVAKNPAANEFLSTQFAARLTSKWYLCIVCGESRVIQKTVEGFIRRDPRNRQRFVHDSKSGKAAKTVFYGLASNGQYQFLLAKPETGRTHQIRVHAKEMHLPILGDPFYARQDSEMGGVRLMLHAWRLGIVLPDRTDQVYFEAPPPNDFLSILDRLGLSDGLLKAESQVLNSGEAIRS